MTPREKSYRVAYLLAQAQLLLGDPEAFAHLQQAMRTDVIFRASTAELQDLLTQLCREPWRPEAGS